MGNFVERLDPEAISIVSESLTGENVALQLAKGEEKKLFLVRIRSWEKVGMSNDCLKDRMKVIAASVPALSSLDVSFGIRITNDDSLRGTNNIVFGGGEKICTLCYEK